MQKIILIGILGVTIVLPILAARERDPRRALRKAFAWTVIGIVVYVVAVVFVYPRFLG